MICVSLNEPDYEKCTALLKKYNFAELRADLCDLTPQQIAHAVHKNQNIIVTYRYSSNYTSIKESGTNNHKANNREENHSFDSLMAAINAGAAYIDIELEYPEILFLRLKQAALNKGCKIILSSHNYSTTPSLRQLTAKMNECIDKGADIIKIVTAAKNITQASKVLQLYSIFNKRKERIAPEENHQSLIAFAMNEAGRFTRPLSVRLGAPFCYVKADEGKETAPGQYSYTEILSSSGGQEITLQSLPSTSKTGFNKDASPTNLQAKQQNELTGGRQSSPTEKCYKNLQEKQNKEKCKLKIGQTDTKRGINIPSSKSEAQRCIIAAIISKGETIINNYTGCKDSASALAIARRLKCEVTIHKKSLKIKSPGAEKIKETLQTNGKNLQLSAGESGLLARLLMPFACYLLSGTSLHIKINGTGTLLKRNITASAKAIEESGCKCITTAFNSVENSTHQYTEATQSKIRRLPCTLYGNVTSGLIRIDGSEGSQIVSGYLMAMPLFTKQITLCLSNPTSIPYIELTTRLLHKFGVTIKREVVPERHKIYFRRAPDCKYSPTTISTTADWSSATAFLIAEAIRLSRNPAAKSVLLKGVHTGSGQADEAIINVLKICGIKLHEEESGLYLTAEQSLSSFNFDATDSPDLFPPLAVLACFCNGKSKIKGISRLYNKESNRAESILSELIILGADIAIVNDYMYICGGKTRCGRGENKSMRGGRVQSHHDHRIAICLTVAALFIEGTVKIDETECIAKSFPLFHKRLAEYLHLIKQY